MAMTSSATLDSDNARAASDQMAARVSWKRDLSAAELLFDCLPDALDVLGIWAQQPGKPDATHVWATAARTASRGRGM
ncbi:MAG TPA: hypothetical protein VJT16_09310 [Streptosporangiaceae bacterium]|nr:hypothetical protein [Streptosporangiaceae bacterium]